MPDVCRSCDAEVVFVPSAKSGAAMILDAVPRKGVVVGLTETQEGGLFAFASRDAVTNADRTLVAPVAKVVDVYTDHHATCPNADDWKGKRR